MVVNARESFHKTVVGRDFVVQRVDDAVFDDGHEGAGFEDRTRFALASDGHVQHLVHPPRGGVAQEVHHGADGSRFDIQHHHATAFDVFVLGDVAAQGFVCDILQVDVEGGAHVHAVHGLFVSFLEILDPAAVIRGAEPHLAFGPVQDIVEFSFQADVVVAVGVAVVLYVADGAAGQRAVRILARIFLFDDHAALVLAFAEERKPLYGLEGFVIDHVPEFEIPAPFLPSFQDEVVVLLGSLVAVNGGQAVAKFAGFFPPGLLAGGAVLPVVGVGFFENRAVHVDLVHGRGHGQQAAVVRDNGAPFGIQGFADALGTEEGFDVFVRGPDPLDVDDAADQQHRGGKERKVEGRQDHADPVASLFLLLLSCHFVPVFLSLLFRLYFWMRAAGFSGRPTLDPFSSNRSRTVVIRFNPASSTTFWAW